MARTRSDLTPSLLGSALLHGGLLALTLVSWPWFGKHMEIGAAVPVTIVASAPVSNIRPAEQAPEEVEALIETPELEATPEPASPPQVEALVVPSSPKPAPKKQAAQPKPAALDLDALAESLKPSRPPKPKSSARKGAARPETAVQARAATGEASALAASALASLSADLARRWNPNCEVEGGSDVDIRVAFRLNASGAVIGRLEASGENSANPVVKAASDRAKRAVLQAEPFEDLPSELYGDRIIVRFNARNACATG
jgi:protein TonB